MKTTTTIIGLVAGMFFVTNTSAIEIPITEEEQLLCHEMAGVAYHVQRIRRVEKATLGDFVENYNDEFGNDRRLVYAIAHKVYEVASDWDNPDFVGSSLYSRCLYTLKQINESRISL